jgi:hypothetical protein
MSYDKYIKYKTKYLQLKAKHVQQGGARGWVIRDRCKHGMPPTNEITEEESNLLDIKKIKGTQVIIRSKELLPTIFYSYVINADGITGTRISKRGTGFFEYEMMYVENPSASFEHIIKKYVQMIRENLQIKLTPCQIAEFKEAKSKALDDSIKKYNMGMPVKSPEYFANLTYTIEYADEVSKGIMRDMKQYKFHLDRVIEHS